MKVWSAERKDLAGSIRTAQLSVRQIEAILQVEGEGQVWGLLMIMQ